MFCIHIESLRDHILLLTNYVHPLINLRLYEYEQKVYYNKIILQENESERFNVKQNLFHFFL